MTQLAVLVAVRRILPSLEPLTLIQHYTNAQYQRDHRPLASLDPDQRARMDQLEIVYAQYNVQDGAYEADIGGEVTRFSSVSAFAMHMMHLRRERAGDGPTKRALNGRDFVRLVGVRPDGSCVLNTPPASKRRGPSGRSSMVMSPSSPADRGRSPQFSRASDNSSRSAADAIVDLNQAAADSAASSAGDGADGAVANAGAGVGDVGGDCVGAVGGTPEALGAAAVVADLSAAAAVGANASAASADRASDNFTQDVHRFRELERQRGQLRHRLEQYVVNKEVELEQLRRRYGEVAAALDAMRAEVERESMQCAADEALLEDAERRV
jgi:hypothetical protein